MVLGTIGVSLCGESLYHGLGDHWGHHYVVSLGQNPPVRWLALVCDT